MKNSINILAGAVLTLATFGTQAFAESSSVKTLSDSDWNTISESAEIENMLEISEIPSLNTVETQNLDLGLLSGTKTNLELNAPFAAEQQVGLVVLDANGELVFSKTGTFGSLKDLRFADYFDWDMTYVVRLYSEDAVYETKLSVVYL